MAVRKIPKSYRNVTGISSSNKSIGEAGFESTLERNVLRIMEFDSDVKSFEVQPVQVAWIDESNKQRIYTPDLLVHFYDKSPILYEIKYRTEISEVIKENRSKFRQAIGFARSKGWRFKFFSEKCIDPVYLKNINFLLPFLNQGPRDESHLQLIEGQLIDMRVTTPKELLDLLFQDEWNRAAVLPSLWYLIASGQIGIDLQAPIAMNSRIWSLHS